MRIVLVAGMPGSGKSIVARAAEDLGIPIYNMGDVIREETMKRFGKITPETMRETSKIVRIEYGEDYVARKTLERVRGEHTIILVDGVRSLVEVNYFRRHGETYILAIHASPRTRFIRIVKRRRPGDPDNWDDFVKRDMIELSFGLGNVIALADFMIVNEGTIEEAYRGAYNILSSLVDEDVKDKNNG